MRPPKGELSPGKLIGLLATKQPVALWNCDTKDYAMTDPTVIGRWVAGYSPSHGDIVLMHDVHPHAVAGIAMMRKLHAYRDVRFRRVSDWLPGSHASFNAEPQATAFHRTEPPPCADPAPAAGR